MLQEMVIKGFLVGEDINRVKKDLNQKVDSFVAKVKKKFGKDCKVHWDMDINMTLILWAEDFEEVKEENIFLTFSLESGTIEFRKENERKEK